MTVKDRRNKRYWGDLTVPSTKAAFFNAVTTPAPVGDGTIATIRIYGPIDSWGGWWGVSAKEVGRVLDALADSVDQIVLRINSPGGEVFEAVSILNMLRAHKASVLAVVDGLAASAASVIAAGCDETVMSPGTQMMVHSPWSFTYGNAAQLRKTAKVLDGVEASIIEIYAAKAGERDWAALLAEDTWMTAKETVDIGLADRIAVIPDAGETETVGEEETVIVIPDEEEPEDSALATRIAARLPRAAIMLPVSAEPGDPNRKDEAMAYGDLQAGLRERLGVTDADASDETLLSALDQALEEQADDTPASAEIPEGAVVIDAAALSELQSNARLGAEARTQQVSDRRDGIVARAIAEGRIAPAARDSWRAQLDKDEDGISALLSSFPANTIPVAEIGHSDTVTSAEDALYDRVYPKKGA